jgi:ribose-phosphate pyrophosphokinase
VTLSLLAGSGNPALAGRIGTALDVRPLKRVLERFADGELQVRLEESVRGHDVYVIQPTSPPVDEHLVELVFLADACRRAGAARLTAVLPYFGYARQDRRATGREAVGGRIAAELMEGAGFARVVGVDLHAPEIEGFFHIPLEHLTAVNLLAGAVHRSRDMIIVAPDVGAAKLAERYQALLDLPVVVLHKVRTSGSDVSLHHIIGDVKGRAPLIVDDMISTAGTIAAAVKGLQEAGCWNQITIAATHLLLVGPALHRLSALPIRQLIGSDSLVPQAALPEHAEIVGLAPILAEAIARLHRDTSLEPLLTHY